MSQPTERWSWEFHPDTKKPIALTCGKEDVLLATGDDTYSWLDVSESRMALLAAAPDLLAALEGLLNERTYRSNIRSARKPDKAFARGVPQYASDMASIVAAADKATAAIKKAKGGAA